MRIGSIAAGIVIVLATGSLAAARCDPAGADAADVAAARAAIAAACDCAGSSSHGAYVRCARATAKATLANHRCVGAVARCAARSTCGRPDAVACCRTTAKGVTRASIKARESACRAPRGGSACVSPFSSACDACTAGGCAVPTPAPTPVLTPTPFQPTPEVTPTSDPTPSPEPNVCGNGILDQGEECDAPTCSTTLNGQPVESECGAPGTLHACECRSTECGGCIEMPGTGALCWADDECLISPSGFPGCPNGSCVPTTCQTVSDCASEAPFGCENGLCCVEGFEPTSFCRVPDQFELPCCGAAVCGAGTFGTCCLPAGESCGDGSVCCSGSCTGGTCD